MDSKKFKKAFIGLAIMVECFILGVLYGRHSADPVVITQDSICYRDSIIIDSIIIENTEIEKQIIYLEKEYMENIDTIVNNDDSTNFVIFSDYISDYQRTAQDR